MNKYLEQIEKWSVKSRKTVVKRLLEQIVGNKHVPEEDLEILESRVRKTYVLNFVPFF